MRLTILFAAVLTISCSKGEKVAPEHENTAPIDPLASQMPMDVFIYDEDSPRRVSGHTSTDDFHDFGKAVIARDKLLVQSIGSRAIGINSNARATLLERDLSKDIAHIRLKSDPNTDLFVHVALVHLKQGAATDKFNKGIKANASLLSLSPF